MDLTLSRLSLTRPVLLMAWLMFTIACSSDSDSSSAYDDAGTNSPSDSAVGATVDIDPFQTDSSVVSGPAFVECEATECNPKGQDCSSGYCVLSEGIALCTETTPGNKAVGEACEMSSECAAGLACFETRTGKSCQELCCPGFDSCSGNQICSGSKVLADSGEDSSWAYCTDPVLDCDIFDFGSNCEQGEACYIISAQGQTQCLREGLADVGESCSSSGLAVQNLCKAGLVCLSSQRCAEFCSLQDGADSGCSSSSDFCVATRFTPDGVGVCYGAQPH